MRRLRVYVSGPITDNGRIADPNLVRRNVQNAIDVGARLIDVGYAPLIPHLNVLAPAFRRFTEAQFLEVDEAWLATADAVLRLPGASEGADREVAFALVLGIPVVSFVAELRHVTPREVYA